MAQETQASLGRRAGVFGLKLALLGLALFLVSRQVSWYDRVTTTEAVEIEGTILEGTVPDAKRIVIRADVGREEGSVWTLEEGEWIEESKVLGLRAAFQRLSLRMYALGMAFIMGMYLLGVARWRMLLHAQGIRASYWEAFRLTFMGFFWNNFMPGMTGGDVAKAVLVAKDSPGRRAEAVSTVIVDRLIGLAVLALMSAVAILSNFSAFRQQGYLVLAVLVACAVVFVCVFSRRVRHRLRIVTIMRKLPGSGILMKLDRAFQFYRSRPRVVLWSIAISFLVHVFNIGHVFIFGEDLGIQASWVTYLATVPVIFIVAAVPVLPGGWGVREAAFILAFKAAGVTGSASLLVLLSVLVGFSAMVYSLLGGVFLFGGRRNGLMPEAIDNPLDQPTGA